MSCDPRVARETAATMFSTVRRQRKPLGHFNPESRLELQYQKAMFKNNAQILRTMCEKSWKQKQRETELSSVDRLNTYLFDTNTSEHTTVINSLTNYSASNIPPEIRWLLTRSARMQRANNAGFSKFRNPVKNRVASAGVRKGPGMSLERQRSMCSRLDGDCDLKDLRNLQCEVLGPDLCTDCTKINNRYENMRQERKTFPRLEVHTRSLVAPEKVEKLYLSHPKELFHQQKKYACGCMVNPELEITTPLVYTPHEVFERIRRRKNIEKGNELLRQERARENKRTNTPDRPVLYEEKTEPPLDMKVSVTFRPDRE